MASTFTCNLLISFLIILYQLHFFCCLAESDSPVEIVASNEQDSNEVDENSNEEDIEIESFVYRELGCPIVTERVHFDLEQFHGAWKIPYGSMNWLTDMTLALLKRNPKVSEIKSLCPEVFVRSLLNSTNSFEDKATMEIDWKCLKKNVEFSIRCWPQREWTQSKFECFFPTINLHSFIMVAATDHISWILLIRCKIGIGTIPGEGMSWLLLSKNEFVDPGTLSVIFGLLEGYGFDVESFKFQYTYDRCNEQEVSNSTTTSSTIKPTTMQDKDDDILSSTKNNPAAAVKVKDSPEKDE